MQRILIVIFLTLLVTSANASPPRIYADDGTYLGTLSRNRFHPESTGNRFGEYGSRFEEDSINNRFGRYGSRFSPYSPNNRFADIDSEDN